ncbi:hypothetical protein [Hymenobacter sp. BRD67]|uniref:hypothetical protein n=1 Tax=Hymenobacter sp. BRD67 TaxID=2675877 RepID=UPI0015650682|nr:hypothetical protein [Hymenobacter sp. BRD67]QKG51512.1 hypothetical protein GKZ67_01550 [Hymenobacter sp. BRD67]
MITDEKRKAVLTAIEQAQDEVAFNKIAALVEELLAPAKRKAGFLQGSVVYQDANWDASLPDAAWSHNQPQS